MITGVPCCTSSAHPSAQVCFFTGLTETTKWKGENPRVPRGPPFSNPQKKGLLGTIKCSLSPYICISILEIITSSAYLGLIWGLFGSCFGVDPVIEAKDHPSTGPETMTPASDLRARLL